MESRPNIVSYGLSRVFEESIRKANNDPDLCFIGVDEAGRGPLAGPVVSASCYIPDHVSIEGIGDSKSISAENRELLFDQITTHPDIIYAVTIVDNLVIDEINILQATLRGMRESAIQVMHNLDGRSWMVLVDGNRDPLIGVETRLVVKGDTKVYSIAAASILAKVTRDRMMLQYDEEFPQYGFKQHKGYPTKSHIEAIKKFKPCPIHRMTFAPIRQKKIN